MKHDSAYICTGWQINAALVHNNALVGTWNLVMRLVLTTVESVHVWQATVHETVMTVRVRMPGRCIKLHEYFMKFKNNGNGQNRFICRTQL